MEEDAETMRGQTWDTLIWTALYPRESSMKSAALDELVRRCRGSHDAVWRVIQSRLEVEAPVGTLEDWEPDPQLLEAEHG